MIRFNISNSNSTLKKNRFVQSVDLVLDGKTVFDDQIIALNNLLLTPGFHTILVNDVATGRTLLDTFLLTLNCYYQVGCLSTHAAPWPAGIDNIYDQLVSGGYLKDKDLEQYFMDSFHSDFIWIEEQPSLTNYHWFDLFKQKIIELHLDQEIPIISLVYRCGAQR